MEDIKKSNKLQGTLKGHTAKGEKRESCLASCQIIRDQSDTEFAAKRLEIESKLQEFVIAQDKEIEASLKTLDERSL